MWPFFQKFNKTKLSSPRISPRYCLALPPIIKFCLKQDPRKLIFFLLEQGSSSIASNILCEFSFFCVSTTVKNKLFLQYMAEITLLCGSSCLWWISFWEILTKVQTTYVALALINFLILLFKQWSVCQSFT